MKKGFILLAAFGLTIAAMALTLQYFSAQSTNVISPSITGRAGMLILDAGHGGEDGGALSVSGAHESKINLSIVLKMDDILAFYGTSPYLLRSEDRSLHDGEATTLREKKVSDLKNRVALIAGFEDATVISIHQNSYIDGRYSGAQVFYAATPGSQELARNIQAAIKASLQPGNNREYKSIPDSIYLMNHITNTAVMVECGFLTNAEEDMLLQSDDYQRKLAALIAGAWLTHLDGPRQMVA